MTSERWRLMQAMSDDAELAGGGTDVSAHSLRYGQEWMAYCHQSGWYRDLFRPWRLYAGDFLVFWEEVRRNYSGRKILSIRH